MAFDAHSLPASRVCEAPAAPGALAGAKTFRFALLGATVAPLLLYSSHTLFAGCGFWTPFVLLVPLFLLIGDSHVFATAYLYLRPRNFAGIRRAAWYLYAIPALLIALSVAVLACAPMSGVVGLMIVFVHYALFHFARQNIGVLAFATLSSTGRPLAAYERFLLNGVAIAGMLGALRLYLPGLLLDPHHFAFDAAPFDELAEDLYQLGILLYAGVIVLAILHVALQRANYSVYSGTMFALCIGWYLPIYLALGHPLLAIASFSTAHGMQYLVFLGAHACRRAQLRKAARSAPAPRAPRRPSATLPLAALALSIGCGALLWRHPEAPFWALGPLLARYAGADALARAGAGLIVGLTLAHFWVDQFIWRSGSRERRQWFAENYPFLVASR